MPMIYVDERINDFREVELGLSASRAVEEARRCLGCDQHVAVEVSPEMCVQCYACQLICSFTYTGTFNPEKERIIIDPRTSIDYDDDCVAGCSLCVKYCAYGALKLH